MTISRNLSILAEGVSSTGVLAFSNTTGSPTVTTSGSDTIIKFTASGSYTA